MCVLLLLLLLLPPSCVAQVSAAPPCTAAQFLHAAARLLVAPACQLIGPPFALCAACARLQSWRPSLPWFLQHLMQQRWRIFSLSAIRSAVCQQPLPLWFFAAAFRSSQCFFQWCSVLRLVLLLQFEVAMAAVPAAQFSEHGTLLFRKQHHWWQHIQQHIQDFGVCDGQQVQQPTAKPTPVLVRFRSSTVPALCK